MTLNELIDRLPLLTGGVFAAGLLLALIAMQFFRRSRRAPYWTQRRQAGQRGFRILLGALAMITFSAILCGLSFIDSYISEPTDDQVNETQFVEIDPTILPSHTSTPTLEDNSEVESSPTDNPTITPTDTVSVTATDTALTEATTVVPSITATGTDTEATSTSTATPQPTATVTSTMSPTRTATPTTTVTPTSAVMTTQVVAIRTPAEDASLSIDTLATRISNDLRPIDPGRRFDSGFRRLYVFTSYENLASGVLWRRALYRDDVLVDDRLDLWGSSTDGETMFFLSLPDNFSAGAYRLEVYIGDEVADEIAFTVD